MPPSWQGAHSATVNIRVICRELFLAHHIAVSEPAHTNVYDKIVTYFNLYRVRVEKYKSKLQILLIRQLCLYYNNAKKHSL